MPRQQFEAGIFLCVCCLSSLAKLSTTRIREEGGIKLATDGPGEEHGEMAIRLRSAIHKTTNFVDGYATHEDEFWKKVRTRRMALLFVTSIMVAIEAVAFGWSILIGEETRTVWQNFTHIIFAFYLFGLTGFSAWTRDVRLHRQVIFHLFSLTSMALPVLFSSIILPPHEISTRRLVQSIFTITFVFAGFWISAGTKGGPGLHFPPNSIYSDKTLASSTKKAEGNVCESLGASPWDVTMFNFTTRVVNFKYADDNIEVGDLPILPLSMRAGYLFVKVNETIRKYKPHILSWAPKLGSGWQLGYQLICSNTSDIKDVVLYTIITVVFFYAPYFFLQRLVYSLEVDPSRSDRSWGWWYCFGLFLSRLLNYLYIEQLWLSTTLFQSRIKVELNTLLFAKTLARKDATSSETTTIQPNGNSSVEERGPAESNPANGDEGNEFANKAQVMNLMTTDVERVSSVAMQLFAIIDSPLEIMVAMVFLYNLLGMSAFIGLAVTCLFIPINQIAGKVVMNAQENLMKSRDKRVSLMNEALSAIRSLKIMASERLFEKRVMSIRGSELRYQRLSYIIETLFNGIWSATPVVVTLVSFWHFAVFKGQTLTPSTAFTSIAIFNELRFALGSLPETIIQGLQGYVSLRRIEKYLNGKEINLPPQAQDSQEIVFKSATVTWPVNEKSPTSVATPSIASTPQHGFRLMDVSIQFPVGELSLICGKFGSGKSLLLLSLLGEADLLAGQISCPRSAPDMIATSEMDINSEDWILQSACAYAPQTAWLQNASIRDNILFNLPFKKERYNRTLEVCALISDLNLLEDGDEAEIGERGVTLSGGQKARVSLARAVYSRASIILLDDVISAVDAHTAHILYHDCLKGDLMVGRTVILISHHVRLCITGAKYIVALERGRVSYSGDATGFEKSGVMSSLVQANAAGHVEDQDEGDTGNLSDPYKIEDIETKVDEETMIPSNSQAEIGGATRRTEEFITPFVSDDDEGELPPVKEKNAARRLIDDEKRELGRIALPVWRMYFNANGGIFFWFTFSLFFALAAMTLPLENAWLAYWSGAPARQDYTHDTVFYIWIYFLISLLGLLIRTFRWLILYNGSIRASLALHERLLRAVLSAQIRFHDTISRGRLLNRFGKDLEGIDSSLADNLGRSIENGASLIVTLAAITFVGGPLFVFVVAGLGVFYYHYAKLYSECGRGLRRLDSVTRSPLYSMYGETIAGVSVIRAFGASAKFMTDMIKCVDTNSNPYYWLWMLNRWVAVRVNSITSTVAGCIGVLVLMLPNISAAQAGFALSFTITISADLVLLMRHVVGLEQAMVAVERVKEFSELPPEGPEIVQPRPPVSWPSEGRIDCEGLVVRYAPELPNVLYDISFSVNPGEKVGILGRTGSGKSTLALSLLRFVEVASGRIVIDGIDISKIGLSDLRSKLTIIPQDPTILSGTLRSALDMFGEYEDAEIYEALRRVHLIPSADPDIPSHNDEANANMFRNLDTLVYEGGENFSAGEKQLLCMVRAILKRSKIIIMDEATASVDYATDELIGKTVRKEFSKSTVITIAHRLRTVVDYDRVMLLEEGRIVEFDSPAKLISDNNSRFYVLCRAAGQQEFAALKEQIAAGQVGA